MRRLHLGLVVALVAMAGMLIGSRSITSVFAQDATPSPPMAMAGNPLVGSWNANTNTADPTNPPSLFIFTADGIYTEVDADGTTAIGAWQATGANTANLTAYSHQTDQKGIFAGTLIIRALITVSADGQSFTAPYTLEWMSPDGKLSGQAGPGTAGGKKIAVEPMGTPTMTLQQLEQSVNPGATPEATPAS